MWQKELLQSAINNISKQLLLQWGVSIKASSAICTLPTIYSDTSYIIQLTQRIVADDTGGGVAAIVANGVNNANLTISSFKISMNGSGNYNGTYWTTIGK